MTTKEKETTIIMNDSEDKTRLATQMSSSDADTSDGTTLMVDEATTIAVPRSEDATQFTTGSYDQTSGLARQGYNLGIINNRFVLEEIIGQGGMGIVYKARDLRKEEAEDKNPFVALKIMNEDFRRHPDAFKAMQRETQKSQRLAHPNIIRVYDFDRDGDVVYMSMELLVGQTLKSLIRNHPSGMEKALAIKIIDGISQALAYAHRNGIVHSDLKPGNVFITDDKQVKVLDFGIARAVPKHAEPEQHSEDFDAGTLGALTPSYASLEMIERKSPHPSDDVYALGIMSYELISGRHPFERLSADRVMVQKLRPTPLPVLKRGQWRALEHALAITRNSRTVDADEFINSFIKQRSFANILLPALLSIALIGATTAFIFKPTNDLPEPILELSLQQHEQLTELAETASLYMSIGQLASPPGDSALDLYNRILTLDPLNRTAIDGKRQIADEYFQLADNAYVNGDHANAKAFADTGLLALPTHEGLKAFLEKLR